MYSSASSFGFKLRMSPQITLRSRVNLLNSSALTATQQEVKCTQTSTEVICKPIKMLVSLNDKQVHHLKRKLKSMAHLPPDCRPTGSQRHASGQAGPSAA